MSSETTLLKLNEIASKAVDLNAKLVHSKKCIHDFKNQWVWNDTGERYKFNSTTHIFLFDIVDVYAKPGWFKKEEFSHKELQYRYFMGHCVTWSEHIYTDNMSLYRSSVDRDASTDIKLCNFEKAYFAEMKNKDKSLGHKFGFVETEILEAALVGDFQRIREIAEEALIVQSLKGNKQ